MITSPIDSREEAPVMSKPSPVKKERGIKARSPKNTTTQAAIAGTLNSIKQLKPRTAKGAQVLDLLKSWLNDKSGYDEKTWPKLKKALERERKRVGARRLFDG
jgi:hypothetical protein